MNRANATVIVRIDGSTMGSHGRMLSMWFRFSNADGRLIEPESENPSWNVSAMFVA